MFAKCCLGIKNIKVMFVALNLLPFYDFFDTSWFIWKISFDKIPHTYIFGVCIALLLMDLSILMIPTFYWQNESKASQVWRNDNKSHMRNNSDTAIFLKGFHCYCFVRLVKILESLNLLQPNSNLLVSNLSNVTETSTRSHRFCNKYLSSF